ncbi:MAG: hypothetical protein HYX57_02795 [Chloroflexi bacterium]|nr:hypothetical protein [Chloroflexota bacterium]
MTFGNNGPIVGHAIIKATGTEREASARAHEAAASRAALDEDELREVEYAAMGLPLPHRETSSRPRRSILRRLLRR